MMKRDLAIAGVIIGALIASAFWGYSRGRSSTAEKYEAQISELKSDWQKQTRAVEKEAQERYEKQSRQLADALAETRLYLTLALCGLLLSGCATPQTPEPRVICKQPEIPETVLKSASPDAKAYSEKAQNWLEKVQSFLQE